MENLKQIEVDGLKVDIALFKGSQSFQILYKIQSTILPALSNIFGIFSGTVSGGMSDILNKDIDLSHLQKGIKDLFLNIGSSSEGLSFIKEILSGVTVYGGDKVYRLKEQSSFDDFFMGRIEVSFLISMEVLKANYPFFLEKISSFAESMSQTNILNQQGESKTESTTESENLQTSPQNSSESGQSGGSILAGILQDQN